MKKSFSTAELVALLNTNHMWVARTAKKENWQAEQRAKKQGGNLWLVQSMPTSTQQTIKDTLFVNLAVLNENENNIVNQNITSFIKKDLTEKQEQIRDARAYVLNIVENIQAEKGVLCGINTFISLVRAEKIEGIEALLTIAKQAQGLISSRTIWNWLSLKKKYGIDGLAPKKKERVNAIFPNWLPKMLVEYRKPSKPSLSQCYENLKKQGLDLPSLRTVQRIVKKLGSVELNRGRMLKREHKSLTAFVRRDFSKLLPTDVYTADGHTVDMYVLHPMHGKPFRPEVTSILDIATRACVGFSISLNENSWGVADALRMSVQNFGIPAIFYTDNGSGFKNKMLETENIGILARLGITAAHSLPYASQARGVIERFQQVFIRGTREFVGYAGKDMDKEALQLVYRHSRKEIKTTGTSKKFLSFEQFLAWVNTQVIEYNNRIHTTLKESPANRWERLKAQATILKPSTEELKDLFRPYEIRTVNRCEIRIFNSIYFSINLERQHTEQVRVGYDIHDPSYIIVRDLDGRFITSAQLNANSVDYFPDSVVEKARENRLKGRLNRIELKKQEALEEFHGVKIVEYLDLTDNQKNTHEELILEFEKEKEIKPLRQEETREERFKWALKQEGALKKGLLAKELLEQLQRYQRTPEYKSMSLMYEDFGESILQNI